MVSIDCRLVVVTIALAVKVEGDMTSSVPDISKKVGFDFRIWDFLYKIKTRGPGLHKSCTDAQICAGRLGPSRRKVRSKTTRQMKLN